MLQWKGHVAKQLVLGSGLGTGVRCRRSGNGALRECRIGGIGSGQKQVLCRSHWLRVASRMLGMLDCCISVLWFLVGPGVPY